MMSGGGYVITKGLIDGHDKKQAQVYGAFVGVASALGVKFVSSVFSLSPVGRDMTWQQLIQVLRGPREPVRYASLSKMEEQLEEFLGSSKLLISAAKTNGSKPLESAVSLFCAGDLGLRSVTFVEISRALEAEVPWLFGKQETTEEGESAAASTSAEEDQAEEAEEDGKPAENEPESGLIVSCDPVFDPVAGVAVTELSVGVGVVCRLPEDSIYHKLFESRFPEFDGSVEGVVNGIKYSEYGTAVIGLDLADGVSGVIKLSGNARIRLTEGARRSQSESGEKGLPIGLVLGFLAVLLLLCLMGALVYFFS